MEMGILQSPIEKEVLERYSGLIHSYQDRYLADESLSDMDVLLFSIYIADKVTQKSKSDYSSVKDYFISFGRKYPNFKVAVSTAKKKGIISKVDQSLLLQIKGLKRIRVLLGQIEKSPVHIIKSGENFSAIKLFEEFLSTEIKGEELLLCDSYISPSTLFPFSVLKGTAAKSIKILTTNIFDSDKLNTYIKKLRKEADLSIEIKISKKIHDRYLICGDSCWSIGSSIKDLGNKDTSIREMNDFLLSLREIFWERWSES